MVSGEKCCLVFTALTSTYVVPNFVTLKVIGRERLHLLQTQTIEALELGLSYGLITEVS